MLPSQAYTVGFQAVPENFAVSGVNQEVTTWSTSLGYNHNSFGSPAFDTSTGRFTVPITGFYSCQSIIRFNGITTTGYRGHL